MKNPKKQLVTTTAFQPKEYVAPEFPFEVKRYLMNLGCIADTEPGLMGTPQGRVLSECCDQFYGLRHVARWEQKPINQVYEAFWSYLRECGITPETISRLDGYYTKFLDECKKYRGMSFQQRAAAVKAATGGLL